MYASNLIVSTPLSALQHFASDLDARGLSVGECALMLAIYSVVWVLFTALRSRKKDSIARARVALEALQTVFTPTHSLWPAKYPSLAVRAANIAPSGSLTLYLELATVYRDLLDNKIEMRDAHRHIPLLVQDGLHTVSGMSISLTIGLHWWFKLLMWIVTSENIADNDSASIVAPITDPDDSPSDLSGKILCFQSPYDRPCTDMIGATLLLPPSSRFLRTLHDDMPAIALDCVRRRNLQSRIRTLQTTMPPGTFSMLGLTTRVGAQTQSLFSKSTAFTALPFLPRTVSPQPPLGREKVRRTTTPMFTSVAVVVQLLTSGSMPLTVEVVRNVSSEYAAYLHRTARDLEGHPDVRAAFVTQWGMHAWIEEKLCTVWEAGLVDGGMLESWVIVVRKPERRG